MSESLPAMPDAVKALLGAAEAPLPPPDFEARVLTKVQATLAALPADAGSPGGEAGGARGTGAGTAGAGAAGAGGTGAGTAGAGAAGGTVVVTKSALVLGGLLLLGAGAGGGVWLGRTVLAPEPAAAAAPAQRATSTAASPSPGDAPPVIVAAAPAAAAPLGGAPDVVAAAAPGSAVPTAGAPPTPGASAPTAAGAASSDRRGAVPPSLPGGTQPPSRDSRIAGAAPTAPPAETGTPNSPVGVAAPAPGTLPPHAMGDAGLRAGTRDLDLSAERAALEVARTALAKGDVAAALQAVQRHERDFPRGRLVEEREVLFIQALAQTGRRDEAAARGRDFRARFPDSLMLPAVDAALAPP